MPQTSTAEYGPTEWMEHIYGSRDGVACAFSGERNGRGLKYQRSSFFEYPKDKAKLVRHIRSEYRTSREIYLCAHLLTAERRTKENAAHIHCLYADRDEAELPEWMPEPTMTVESSPGRFQDFWRLSTPVEPERAEALSQRIAYATGADKSGWDLTQVLRVPLTKNRKYEGEPTVRVIHFDAEKRYTVEQLDEVLPEAPAKPSRNGHQGAPYGCAGGASEAPLMLPEWALKVYRGDEPKVDETGEIDRSGTLMKIGRVLYDAGAERALIVPTLRERDEALGYRKYSERSDAETRYHEIVDELECNGRNYKPKAVPTNENSSEAPPNIEDIGVTKALADAILAEDHFARDAGGKLYRFADGVYKTRGELYIKQRVQQLLEAWGYTKRWSARRGEETAEYIALRSPELWERPPLEEINARNGILNTTTRHLRPHDPTFLSTVRIPVAYNPDATCPAWDAFVATTFPEDAQDLAYELPADLMSPERSVQKSILLIGEGSNGKSTYLTALGAFIGTTNIVGLSLQKMEADRFSASRLLGKLANICPDLPSSHLAGTSMFKAVTGGDAINAEYKYKESFEFRPFARLVFSANLVPRSEDATHAFFRRWLVVPFDRTFEGGEQIPRQELDARLSDPRELSGVLNKALDALPRLRQSGFTESASMQAAWQEFRAMTDPVSVWLDKNTVAGADAFVAKDDLLQAYNKSADADGRTRMTGKAFGQALKRVRPTIREAQRTIHGKPKTWVWLGIGLAVPNPDGPDQGPGAYYEANADSLDSRDSRDASNCLISEETPQQQDDSREEPH